MNSDRAISICLEPRKVFFVFLGIIALLAVAHLCGQFARFVLGHSSMLGLVPAFDLGNERNFPTVWSSFQLLFCSFFVGSMAAYSLRGRERFALRWVILSVLFACMSVDELVGIHEHSGKLVDFIFDQFGIELSGMLMYSWVIPASIFIVVFVIYYGSFLMSLPRTTMIGFCAAGTLFVSGAVGLEVFEADIDSSGGYANLPYSILVTFEELFEMIGISLFIYVLLRHMASLGISCRVKIG